MLYAFAAKGDIRWYLNESICVDPQEGGGCILATTDGHCAMLIKDSSAVCDKRAIVQISRDMLRFCTKKEKDENAKATVDAQNHLVISLCEKEIYIRPGDCLSLNEKSKYPDVSKILPKFANLELRNQNAVNAKYLSKALSVHPHFSRSGKIPAIRIWQAEENSVIAIEYCGHPEILALIMPWRDAPEPKSHRKQWADIFAPGTCEGNLP